MKTEWRLLGNPLKTMGFDGYTDSNSNSVLNITVSALGVTACQDSIDPGIHSEDHLWLKTTILEALRSSAQNVEEYFAGLVCDNTITNMNALGHLESEYPKLITAGCVAHLSDLIIEDIFRIMEAGYILKNVRSVAVFIKSHRRVKKLYIDICRTVMVGTVGNGTMLKLYPDTRFSYADLMLQQYLRNKLYLEQLILHPEFEDICLKISSCKVDEFKDIILPSITSDNHRFDRKVALLHDLIKLVCKLIHHVEQKLCKASWINALFFALMKDFDAWSNNNHVQATFDVDFITAVHKALTDRWRGEREGDNGRVRSIRPFKSKVWTAAVMFDPYYTPTEEEYSMAMDDDVLDYVSSLQNMIEPYLGTDN